MNDEEVISELMRLDRKGYVEIGRLRPNSGDVMSRLLLHDLGFSLLDERDMLRFRRLHTEAGKRLSKMTMAENIKKAEQARKELADAIRKVKDRILISPTDQKNITTKGTSLFWTCPKCGEKQEADLSRGEDDPKFLKVNGKHVILQRKRGASLGPRMMPAGTIIPGETASGKTNNIPMTRAGMDIVGLPPGYSKPAVVRLSGGDKISFQFGCSKCRFTNRTVEIGVKAK